MKPKKTQNEKILFAKYQKWLHSEEVIPQDVVNEYLTDLKKLKK
jgi:hypothetical protein